MFFVCIAGGHFSLTLLRSLHAFMVHSSISDHINASKCGVLVVGKKKSGKLWSLDTEEIKEVNEYKYFKWEFGLIGRQRATIISII